jgi:uncharacterized protein (DUF488 family)
VKTLFTIGHSTRPLPAFLALLAAHGVRQVVDVRTIPRSRRNPQFERDALRAALRKARIAYRHLPALGGLRHPARDSVNRGWRNASFRGFADYMATPEFSRGMGRLRQLAQRKPTAIMCAEAVPWRCHRSLISDALTVRKWRVLHIQSRRTARPHEPTAFLRIRGGKLVYPAPRAPRAVRRRARPVPGASG